MQTKREYLVNLGLAKANARGRFSLEAKEALVKARAEGVTFSDDNKPKPTPRISKSDKAKLTVFADNAPAVAPKSRKIVERVRAQGHGYVIAPRPSGAPSFISKPKVAVTTCGSCGKGVGFCKGHGENNLPQAPGYLGGGDIFFE